MQPVSGPNRVETIFRAPAPTPWLPLTLASVAAGVAGLWMLQWLLVVVLSSGASMVPQGARYVGRSTVEIALGITRHVGLPLLAVALVVTTWRYGLQGRRARCWLVAIATVCVTTAAVSA